MAGVENRHIVFFRHFIDCRKQACEVLLGINIFFAVCREQNISALFQSEARMNVACLDFGKVVMKHFRHGRAGHISTFFGQPAVGKIPASVFGIGHIDVGNDIDDSSVCFFRQTFVLAAVSGFHMEDRDMQSFGSDDRKAAVGIA